MAHWSPLFSVSVLALTLLPFPATADCPYEFGIEWGSYGSGPEQFQFAYDTALTPEGDLIVADHRNDLIKKFDVNGQLLLSFGSTGAGPGQFRRPVAVAVDGTGNILVVELLNFRLQKFAANGSYVTEWPLPGEGSYQDILDLAADDAGNVYVPDPSEGLLYKFGPDGTLLTSWSSGDPTWRPAAVSLDENGILYASYAGFYMKLTTELTVTRPVREKQGQPANQAILREIAGLTGGAHADAGKIETLLGEISALPEPEPAEFRTRLWSNPWWGGLILGLLAIYWTGRKVAGML